MVVNYSGSYELAFFNENLRFAIKHPKSDSLCRWRTLLQKNAQKDSLCRWWSLLSKNARKSFSVGDEVSVFLASKVSRTTTVTPFPVWCACSLNRKIPLLETSPKTTSRMPGSSKRWLAISFLAWPVVCSLTWDSSRNHHDVMSRKKMDPF